MFVLFIFFFWPLSVIVCHCPSFFDLLLLICYLLTLVDGSYWVILACSKIIWSWIMCILVFFLLSNFLFRRYNVCELPVLCSRHSLFYKICSSVIVKLSNSCHDCRLQLNLGLRHVFYLFSLIMGIWYMYLICLNRQFSKSKFLLLNSENHISRPCKFSTTCIWKKIFIIN